MAFDFGSALGGAAVNKGVDFLFDLLSGGGGGGGGVDVRNIMFFVICWY